MSKAFGDVLREARQNHRPPLTQEQLARQIGVVSSAVAKWESGLRKPSYGILLQLFDLFGRSFINAVVALERDDKAPARKRV